MLFISDVKMEERFNACRYLLSFPFVLMVRNLVRSWKLELISSVLGRIRSATRRITSLGWSNLKKLTSFDEETENKATILMRVKEGAARRLRLSRTRPTAFEEISDEWIRMLSFYQSFQRTPFCSLYAQLGSDYDASSWPIKSLRLLWEAVALVAC